MKDNKSLYFIPLIAKAYEEPDKYSAFQSAIKEIVRLGKLPEYKNGYHQFKQFIGSGLESLLKDHHKNEIIDETIHNLFTNLALDFIESSQKTKDKILDQIKSHPELYKKYEKILIDINANFKGQPPFVIELFKDEILISSKQISDNLKTVIFSNIDPGQYTLKLSNGRFLWNGEISEKDIIWEYAFPGIKYNMAADTGQSDSNSTRKEKIFNGEISLEVFAGLESGRIEITF